MDQLTQTLDDLAAAYTHGFAAYVILAIPVEGLPRDGWSAVAQPTGDWIIYELPGP